MISEATLSSRVSAVRRAIGDNGDDQLFVRTHHKRGFRFVGQVEDAAPFEMAADRRPAATKFPESWAHSKAAMPALALPDKPSIAVLPFQNRSGDSIQEYFADGLTEDIITGLSGSHGSPSSPATHLLPIRARPSMSATWRPSWA